MVNILRALMDKADSLQEQVVNITREMGNLRGNQKRSCRNQKQYYSNEKRLSWAH
jgi:hypothetical protein